MSEHTARQVPLDDVVARIARLDAGDGFGTRVRERLDDKHAARDQVGVRAWLVPLGAAAMTVTVALFVWSSWQEPVAPPTGAAHHEAVDATAREARAAASSQHVAAGAPPDTSNAPPSVSKGPSRQSRKRVVAASMAAVSVSSGPTGERQPPGAEAWAALQPEPIDVVPIEVTALENHRLDIDAIHVAPIEVEPLPPHVPVGETRSPL